MLYLYVNILKWLMFYITINYARGERQAKLISNLDPTVVNIIERNGEIFLEKENAKNARYLVNKLNLSGSQLYQGLYNAVNRGNTNKYTSSNELKNNAIHELLTKLSRNNIELRYVDDRDDASGFVDKTLVETINNNKRNRLDETNEDSSVEINNVNIITNMVKTIKSLVPDASSPELKLKTLDTLLNVIDMLKSHIAKRPKVGSDLMKFARINDIYKEADQANKNENQFESTDVMKHLPPRQHFYQYWMYKTPIHTDECPPNQTKIGNVCSWYPPHKR